MNTTKRNDIAFRAAKERREDRIAIGDSASEESRLIRACREAEAAEELADAANTEASARFFGNDDELLDADLEATYIASNLALTAARTYAMECTTALWQWRRAQS